MRKILYSVIAFIFLLIGCDSGNNDYHVIRSSYVDISDLAIYAGAASGAKEVKFNNLKKTDLAVHFFQGTYNKKLYDKIQITFDGDRMTYVYRDENNQSYKIVSGYVFRNDSLFAVKTDGTTEFAALGSSPDFLYRRKSLAFYPYTTLEGARRDTVVTFDHTIDLKEDFSALPLSLYNSLDDVKVVTDTVVWCNVIYLFQ